MRKALLFLLCFPYASLAIGQNVMGRIISNGIGVPNVMVSDGQVVTVTDENGKYEFTSTKHYPYVFYCIPRGYLPELKNNFNPQFWQALDSEHVDKVEYHNFTLIPQDNDNYHIAIGADSHLANRTSDLEQFRTGYLARLRAEKRESDVPVYSMILGDMTWDNYWYARSYNLQSFYNTCKTYAYPVALFPVIGNHDNDGGTTPGNDTDFLSAQPWRKIVSPTFYSFNLGRVHYVVLDDIYYKNEDTGGTYSKGIVGSRNYDALITDDQYEWLAKDLALVEDKETPIIIGMHIPNWSLASKAPFAVSSRLANNCAERLCEVVKDFKNVHIVTGHTHYNYCAHPSDYPNVMEHNIAAICATWWWTGYVSGHHVCQDGSPGGYSYWTVNGTDISWEYHSCEDNGNLQMRIYDMNTVKEYFATDENAKKFLALYPTRKTFSTLPANTIYVNVFGYDTDWKVEVYEGASKRSVTRLNEEDPYHTIAYDIPRTIANGSYTTDFGSKSTRHMFRSYMATATQPVTVRVTDRFGRVYVQSIERPHPYSLDMDKIQSDADLTGVSGLRPAERLKAYSRDGKLCIDSPAAQTAIVALPDGRSITRRLVRGSNIISLPGVRGICIVRAGDESVKVTVKG